MSSPIADKTPKWTVAVPAASAVLVLLIFAHVIPESSIVLLISAVALGACVFAAVHHAEVLAVKVGDPLGSIILAAAVTVIEVGLIVSIMLSGAEGSEMVARDTVYSALMIVLNGVIGFALLLGAGKHFEQGFQVSSTSAALGVLGTIATVVFVLPVFVVAGGPMQFSNAQMSIVGVLCLALYAMFIFMQTVKHRDYFMSEDAGHAGDHMVPNRKVTLASAVLLPVSLLFVILLAKVLSHPLDSAVAAAGLPQAVVGVVVAAVVLLPEGIASVRAALLNRFQNSVNLVLGSALASIGISIPVVSALAVLTGRPVTLGLPPQSIVLLLLTLFVSTLTLGTGRTTTLHGAIHLTIFAVFLLVSVSP